MNVYEYMARFDDGTISARDTLDLFAWIASKEPLENLTGRYQTRAAELVEFDVLADRAHTCSG